MSLNDLIYGKKFKKTWTTNKCERCSTPKQTYIYDHVLISEILENQLKEKGSKFMPADQKWKGKISK